jgi:hypothetical protein
MTAPAFTVLFCDGAVNNGKWNLVGVFDRVWLSSFPGQLPMFHVFLQVTDLIVGDGAEVRIEIVDATADEQGNMRNDAIWGADINLRRGSETGNTPFRGGVAIPVVTPNGQAVIAPRPGDYEVRVLYHGELQDVAVLPIAQKSTGGQ